MLRSMPLPTLSMVVVVFLIAFLHVIVFLINRGHRRRAAIRQLVHIYAVLTVSVRV